MECQPALQQSHVAGQCDRHGAAHLDTHAHVHEVLVIEEVEPAGHDSLNEAVPMARSLTADSLTVAAVEEHGNRLAS
jgi:hypothetical protein